MTSAASAKWLIALVHTIEGRKEVLVVQEGVDCQVQRDCDQVQVIDTGDRERSDSAMGAQWCEVVSLMNQKELQYWFQVGK